MSTTLAQAITDLGLKAHSFERPAGPVLDPLLEAIELVVSARARLTGLEEGTALIETRSHAYERAAELLERANLNGDVSYPALLDLAAFLAPPWLELENPDDDPLGPTDSVSELEAKLTIAEETVLAQRDLIAELITERDELADQLELVRTDSTVLTLWGEELGRMTKADAERASIVIQRELSARSATAQRAEERLASAEAEAAAFAGTLQRIEGERDDLRSALETSTADRERALELIRGHVHDIEAERVKATQAEELLAEALERAATWETRARVLNPLFGGPQIEDDLPDLSTLNSTGVGLHGDNIAFIVWGRELERDEALVMAAHVVAIADRAGRFAAVYRKVCNA